LICPILYLVDWAIVSK